MDYDRNLLEMLEYCLQYYRVEYTINPNADNSIIGEFRLDQDRACILYGLATENRISVQIEFPMTINEKSAPGIALYCMRHNHESDGNHFDLDYERGKVFLKLNGRGIAFHDYSIFALDEAVSGILSMTSHTFNELVMLSKDI